MKTLILGCSMMITGLFCAGNPLYTILMTSFYSPFNNSVSLKIYLYCFIFLGFAITGLCLAVVSILFDLDGALSRKISPKPQESKTENDAGTDGAQ